MDEVAQKTFTVIITGPDLAEPAMLKLEKKCRVICIKPYTLSEEIAGIVGENQADALIVRMGQIGEEVISASPKLKAITKHGTGVDNIDLTAATRIKVPVMITPDANFESVAEHALGLMLAIARGTVYLNSRMGQGHWDKSTYKGMELFEKTLGIVGFGRIGYRLSELVRPLNMKILVFDPVAAIQGDKFGVSVVTELDDLLKASDFVSLCCPLTSQTAGMIDARAMGTMKETAWLINTARGGLIDEKALADALEAKAIAGAALDTVTQEPPEDIHPLTRFDNVILTPHIGGVSNESFTRMGLQAVKNVLDVLEGAPLDKACVLNPEIL